MFIGENPDSSFFTALQQEGYEAIASESPQQAWPYDLRISTGFDHRSPAPSEQE